MLWGQMQRSISEQRKEAYSIVGIAFLRRWHLCSSLKTVKVLTTQDMCIPIRGNTFVCLIYSKNNRVSLAKGNVVEHEIRALRIKTSYLEISRPLYSIIVFAFTLRKIGSHWRFLRRERMVTGKGFYKTPSE